MLRSIENMFFSLNKNDVEYCHWKSNEHLLAALNGDTDLDILFNYEQRNVIDIVLNECGLKRFRSMPLSQYNAIEDYIGFDEETGKIWHLHLHYRLTIGEVNLKSYTVNIWNKLLLENRQEVYNSVYISACEDEIILLFVRMALKLRVTDWFRKISDDDRREYKWLKDRVNESQLDNRIRLFLGDDFVVCLKRIIDMGINYRVELRSLQIALYKKLKYFTGLSRCASFIKGNIRSIYSIYGGVCRRLFPEKTFPYRRISPSGGCVIAFVGSDGAGKSTSIRHIQEELTKKLDVKIIYLGSGDGSCSMIRRPMRFFAKRISGKGLGSAVKKEQIDSVNKKAKLSLKSRVYIFAKFVWAMTLAWEKANKFESMVKSRNEGMIILLDRYPQLLKPDSCDGLLLYNYLNSSNYLLRTVALYEKNIYKSFEKNPPDIFIKLIVDPEIAIQRKNDMTIKEIEEKRDIVLQMYPKEKSYIIDTNRDKDETLSAIMKYIWRHI